MDFIARDELALTILSTVYHALNVVVAILNAMPVLSEVC
jgi:hypothetical protein